MHTTRAHCLSIWLPALLLAGAPALRAEVPAMLNYQGRLVQGTNLYSGGLNLTFRLYATNTGGSALLVSTNYALAVDGLYATHIGQFVTSGSLDRALDNPEVWLEVEVNGQVLTPRERLAAPEARVGR